MPLNNCVLVWTEEISCEESTLLTYLLVNLSTTLKTRFSQLFHQSLTMAGKSFSVIWYTEQAKCGIWDDRAPAPKRERKAVEILWHISHKCWFLHTTYKKCHTNTTVLTEISCTCSFPICYSKCSFDSAFLHQSDFSVS